MKEALLPPLFPSPDGEQSDDANDIQDKYHNQVDAKVKELAFGAEDEAVYIYGCQETKSVRGCLWREWDGKEEGGARAFPTFHPHSPSLTFDDLGGNIEAEPKSRNRC